jgi:hypothetical protein
MRVFPELALSVPFAALQTLRACPMPKRSVGFSPLRPSEAYIPALSISLNMNALPDAFR